MPNVFSGLQFESPLEAQNRIRAEQGQRAVALSGNSRSQIGYVLGSALFRGIDKLRGKEPESVSRARTTESVVAQTNDELQQALEDGSDPLAAQFDATMRAAQRFSAMGRTDLASQLTSQAVSLKHQIEERDLQRRKLRAEIGAKGATALADRQKQEDDLRKEVDAQLEDTTVVVDQLQAVEKNAQQNSPAGDLAMIFSFMKVLDPNSVVRESEFATVAQAREGLLAAAAGQSVEGMDVQQEVAARAVAFLRGNRFTDITRAQIINAARSAAQDRVAGSQAIIDDALELADAREFDREAVRSGLAERVQGVNVEQLTPEQLQAVASGSVSLTDALAGRLPSDDDVRRDARRILGIQ